MKRNFSVFSETTLKIGKEAYDLHNDFVFEGLFFSPVERVAKIFFGEIGENRAEKLEILFRSVSIIRVHGLDDGIPVTEDGCLDCFGFLHPDDLDTMNGFLPESASAEGYHMIFLFRGGLVVKLFSEAALVRRWTSRSDLGGA